jgi:hypothetical protein
MPAIHRPSCSKDESPPSKTPTSSASAQRPAPTRLVNRSAGLLKRVNAQAQPKDGKPAIEGKKDYIRCKGDIVDISTLKPDPMNARLHGERNLEAIKESLSIYGQVKPLVVRKDTRVVAAGNGTMEAAKQLGWTKLAANFVEFSDAEAMGYGLADNRTAELAKWNFEVVAKLDALMKEQNQANMVGWTDDELEVLRKGDFSPPEESGVVKNQANNLKLQFSEEQARVVAKVVEILGREDLNNSEAVLEILIEWLQSKGVTEV